MADQCLLDVFHLYDDLTVPLLRVCDAFQENCGLQQVSVEIRNAHAHFNWLFQASDPDEEASQLKRALRHIERATADLFKVIIHHALNHISVDGLRADRVGLQIRQELAELSRPGINASLSTFRERWLPLVDLAFEAMDGLMEGIPKEVLAAIQLLHQMEEREATVLSFASFRDRLAPCLTPLSDYFAYSVDHASLYGYRCDGEWRRQIRLFSRLCRCYFMDDLDELQEYRNDLSRVTLDLSAEIKVYYGGLIEKELVFLSEQEGAGNLLAHRDTLKREAKVLLTDPAAYPTEKFRALYQRIILVIEELGLTVPVSKFVYSPHNGRLLSIDEFSARIVEGGLSDEHSEEAYWRYCYEASQNEKGYAEAYRRAYRWCQKYSMLEAGPIDSPEQAEELERLKEQLLEARDNYDRLLERTQSSQRLLNYLERNSPVEAVVWFADVKGSSTGEDPERVHGIIQHMLKGILVNHDPEPESAAPWDRHIYVLNTWGDAILCVARDMQTALRSIADADRVAVRKGIEIRYGVSAGPVTFVPNCILGIDVTGQVVVEAARLEPSGEVGHAIVPASVAEDHGVVELCARETLGNCSESSVEFKKSFGEKGAGESLEVVKIALR
jgi:class 3 adenylate cyclase